MPVAGFAVVWEFWFLWRLRLNDLHRVVASYRPALKALAGHAETQAEEMGFRQTRSVVALQPTAPVEGQ